MKRALTVGGFSKYAAGNYQQTNPIPRDNLGIPADDESPERNLIARSQVEKFENKYRDSNWRDALYRQRNSQ